MANSSKLAVYRKAVVAGIGVAAMVAASAGVVIAPGLPDALTALVDAVFGVATVVAVHQVPNASPLQSTVAPPAPK